MSHIQVFCYECTRPHPDSMTVIRCQSCNGPLDVAYVTDKSGSSKRSQDCMLPLHTDDIVTLGEGNTPMVSLDTLGRKLAVKSLIAKLEFANPTGSFKDRGTSIMVSMAKEQRVTEIVEDSSGNAGASVAAYAARAKITAHIFAPINAPPTKIQQISVYGAKTHLIPGPRENAATAAAEYCNSQAHIYASHNLSPYFIEGTKTFAYELYEDLGPTMPSHIIMPVGNGSLFIGTHKGLSDLITKNKISSMPKLHAIQSQEIMPLVAAYRGMEWTPHATRTSTVAGGISISTPSRLRQSLEIIKATNGTATSVTDKSIMHWQTVLAEEEGIYAEPTSAAAFAGLEQLISNGNISTQDTVLIPITGTGLKDNPPLER